MFGFGFYGLWVVSFGSHRFRVFGAVVRTSADLSGGLLGNTWLFSGERMLGVE